MGKKEAHCDRADPADACQGDNWDHVAFDPESRLVLEVVPGKRTWANAVRLVAQLKARMGDRLPDLLTSDEYPVYASAILEVYGTKLQPSRTGKPGRPKKAVLIAPPGLNYATVHKTRKQGRVVKVERKIVFGSADSVAAAVARSTVGRTINTSFLERHNGTERHRNSRKTRKTCGFSKDWDAHESMTYFSNYASNFCWPVRTLRQQIGGRWQRRTPAMAAGLADRVWSLRDWLTLPAVQRK